MTAPTSSLAETRAAKTTRTNQWHLALRLGFFYNSAEMAAGTLGEFEQIVLLAILRLGDGAYGVSIRNEILSCTGRDATPGALYTTLDRLEEKSMVQSRLGDPTPQRGGRSKRFFTVTRGGVQAVAASQQAYRSLLRGLTLPGVASA